MGGVPGPSTTCSGNVCGDVACCIDQPTGNGDFCDTCNLYTCDVTLGGTSQGTGTSCSGLPRFNDGDAVPDACDNCPINLNPGQEDADGDDVGDDCDNCTPTNPLHHCGDPGVDCVNPGQVDGDGDGIGDACDNCNLPNPDQADCNNNGIGDACEPDCDGNGTIDDCDNDIDGDGVNNAADRCDYTPMGAAIDNVTTSPFYGTLRADLDGDCDVDAADAAILNGLITGQGDCVANGQDVEDALCGPCPSCNSCCTSFLVR